MELAGRRWTLQVVIQIALELNSHRRERRNSNQRSTQRKHGVPPTWTDLWRWNNTIARWQKCERGTATWEALHLRTLYLMHSARVVKLPAARRVEWPPLAAELKEVSNNWTHLSQKSTRTSLSSGEQSRVEAKSLVEWPEGHRWHQVKILQALLVTQAVELEELVATICLIRAKINLSVRSKAHSQVVLHNAQPVEVITKRAALVAAAASSNHLPAWLPKLRQPRSVEEYQINPSRVDCRASATEPEVDKSEDNLAQVKGLRMKLLAATLCSRDWQIWKQNWTPSTSPASPKNDQR